MKTETVQKPSAILPWLMWGLGAIFYFYEYLIQVSPSVMTSALMRDFGVNATSLGALTATFLYAYAGMQIPVGMFLDKFGPRRLLTAAALLCATGCFFFATASTLSLAMIGRFFIGMGAAGAVVSCMKLATNWFAFERFGLLTGLLLMFGMMGALGGEAPVALLVAKLDWRNSMLLLGTIGVLLSALIWFKMKDAPAHATSHIINISPNGDLFVGLFKVMRSRQTWIIALYAGLMFAPTLAFGGLWGVPFLKQLYGISNPAAAAMISFLFLGWAVGAPVTGWVAGYINRSLPVMITGSIGTLIISLCIIYLPIPLVMMNVFLFAFGFFSSGFLPAFTIMRETSPPEVTATSLGFMNMMNTVGGAVLQPLIGIFLDLTWKGEIVDGARVYSTDNFHVALSMLPVFIVIALFFTFLMHEKCRQKSI